MLKNRIYRYILPLFAVVLITACERNVPDEEIVSEELEISIDSVEDTWDYTLATKIELLNTTANIEGTGATVAGSLITISDTGMYYISGSLNEGQIKVSAEEKIVTLILDNVNIANDDNACIFIESAEEVIIILNSESQNTLTDSEDYSDEEQNAVIFSKSNLSITGEGKLTVNALHEDGIYSINSFSGKGLKAGELIQIDNGTLTINSSDDGINGPSESGYGASFDCSFIVNGGFISVNSGGDGIDIGGTTTMNMGTVIVHGPTENNNGAIDCDAGFYIHGGVLSAGGSSGMAESPENSSSQNSLMIYFTSTIQAGSMICLKDSQSNDIIVYQPKKAIESLVISSNKLIQGNDYSIYTGGSFSGTFQNGLGIDGSHSNGYLYETVTISGTVTTLGNGGGTGPGGGGPGGG
jgi:hypothetical protein